MTIYKERNGLLVFNILSDVICTAMVPFIPIGFIYMNKGWYMLALAIVGILCACFLMYGTVFFWIRFGTLNRRCKVYDAIMVDHLYTIDDINKYKGIRKEYIDVDIRYLIQCRYLVGYLFDGKTLTLNKNIKLDNNIRIIKSCPNCGASDTKKLEDNTFYCPYCNSKF